MATPTDVRNASLDCDFDALEDAKIQPFLVEAAVHMGGWLALGATLETYDLGHSLLAAHLIAIARHGAKGAKGPQTSAKLGPASRSWAAPRASTSRRAPPSLQTHASSYGQRWEALLDTLPIGPTVAVDGVTWNPTIP